MVSCPINKLERYIIIALIIIIGLFVMSDLLNPRVDRVVMDEDIKTELFAKYDNVKEFGVCLKGTIDDNVAYVTDIYYPSQTGTHSHLDYEHCKGYGVLGFLHSHPVNDCLFSPEDNFAFGRSGNAIQGIICSPTNMIFTNTNLEYIEEG